MNVGGLLLLLVYIYAVLGMNLFATVMLSAPYNTNLNFQGIGSALTLLLELSTGDSYYEFMLSAGM